ncbi:MAG: AI-2E family transporter [Spirochaetota bacterium]
MEDQGTQKLQTAALTFIALIGLGVFLHITRSFVVPFVVAVLLSFLLVPVADFFARLKVPGFIINSMVILGMFIMLAAVGFLTFGAMNSIKSELPEYADKFRSSFRAIVNSLKGFIQVDIATEYRDVTFQQLFNMISPASIFQTINQSVGTFITFLSKLTLMMIFLIFILSGRKVLVDKILFVLDAREDISKNNFKAMQSISRQIQTYLWLKVVISIFTGLVFGIVAYVMGLDFAIIWGFLGFILNFIPTIGPIVASIPPIILSFLQFESILWALFTSICLAGVQFLSGNVIEPIVMGDRLNLNIITILLSLFLWGLIWGIPGMILAVPITAAVNIMFQNIPRYNGIAVLMSK